MPCDETFFGELTKAHRTNQFAMEARKRADLSLGALLRTQLGWTLAKPAEERKAIAEQAADLIATGEKLLKWEERLAKKPDSKAKPPEGLSEPVFQEWQQVIMAALRGRLPMSMLEDDAAARMDEMAEQLPVAGWWKENVFSGSLTSLARITAEVGDFTKYPTIAKVWKRMGLAVMGDVRQGGLAKGAKAEAWISHGYSPKRRAIMYVIGGSLIKQNEHYHGIYLAEKERQRAKAEDEGLIVAPSATIPDKRKAEFRSDGHVHKRAQRYMEKRLLRDLWVAWQAEAKVAVKPICVLPPHPISEAA